jgi:hypothetical protein
MLRPEDRERVVAEMTALHKIEPKLMDMKPAIVQGYLRPPQNPSECIFARTTACLSSDLEKTISPCQYGGNPDCTQCGCMASVGLGALGRYRLGGLVPLQPIFTGSLAVGRVARALRGGEPKPRRPPFAEPDISAAK